MSDSGNVIQLPRPKTARSDAPEMGLFFRVGRNDHRTMLDLIAEGEKRFFGLVFEAQHTHRHRELRAEARKRGIDTILDPKTQALAMIGGHNHSIGVLPWADPTRPHRLDDFSGDSLRDIAGKIVDHAAENGYTQILGPTHFLQDHNDPWLKADIAALVAMKRHIETAGLDIELIYPLSLPIDVLREPAYRGAVVEAIRDAPFDVIWFKIDNFGADASGEKTVAYIEAARDFHQLGVPIIADYVGGLPGLGLLAFGAVGGIAHGITLYEGFKSYSLRKPPKQSNSARAIPVRVYLPRLDMHLKKEEAQILLNASNRIKSRFGCTDTHCCSGIKGQLERPARHFVHQRSREVDEISAMPDSVRAGSYLDNYVRRVSDDVAAISGSAALPEDMRGKLQKKQTAIGRFRGSLANLVEADRFGESAAMLPERLSERRKGSN